MKKELIFYIAMSILMAAIAISTFFIINGFSNKYENVNSYYIEGKIINNTLDRADTSSIQYKEYNDETKYDFIDQFINHALPTRDIY